MPTFVHITTEDIAKRAKRSGLKPGKVKSRLANGVFAMPVIPNFQLSHQWIREMGRWKRGPMLGVYFRIPDTERVLVGRYNTQHEEMTAAEAAARLMAETRMTGIEIIVPRRILPKEIVRVREVPYVVGWRYYPESRGQHPWACECCQKGGYRSRKIREKLGARP